MPDDVKGLLSGVVYHRLVLKPEAEAEGRTRGQVIEAALESVAVPERVGVRGSDSPLTVVEGAGALRLMLPARIAAGGRWRPE